MKIKNLLNNTADKTAVNISGWVRTKRGSKNVAFIALNDGSSINNIQIVAESINFSEELLKKITTGACINVKGTLVASRGDKQSVEVLADEIVILGTADSDKYPLQPKKHSLGLRENAHLRFRTNTFSAVFRLRHSLTFFTFINFLMIEGFNLHSPIITGADAEGAGEMFHVTSLNLENPPKDKNGKIDFQRFFWKQNTSYCFWAT